MLIRKERGLIVFAKPPVGGTVKTRLVPAIGSRHAALLYRSFLLDSVAQYRRIGYPIRLYFGDGEIPGELVDHHPDVEVLRQDGKDLGERMANAFLETFGAGFNSAVIIGTDHPSLPDEYIRLAFDLLSEPKTIVLGPSEDGGYYLLGMNHFFPQLFRGMEYSHSAVLDQTIDRALETDALLTLLPLWYDVDTPEMLARLLHDLRSDPARAPRTAELLEVLADRHSFFQ